MQQIGRIRIAGAMELQNVSRELRRLVNLDAVVCRKDGECFPILLTDISRDGCPFRTDAPSRRATLSRETRALGDLPAEVRWACAGCVGTLFLRQD
jgi:hypothetical protein